PKGRMAIFFGSWYTQPILGRVFGEIGRAGLDQSLDRIVELEHMLSDENVLLVKLWLHLSKPAQKQRLKTLEKDPLSRWRVTKRDWMFFDRYARFREVSAPAITRTSTGEAPWTLVEAADARHRTLAVATALDEAIRARAARPAPPKPQKPPPPPPPA